MNTPKLNERYFVIFMVELKYVEHVPSFSFPIFSVEIERFRFDYHYLSLA
jgi:hypothetical protein